MRTRTLTRRCEAAASTARAALRCSEITAARVTERLEAPASPHLGDALGTVQSTLAAHLTTLTEALRQAEADEMSAQARADRLRGERDRAAGELRRRLLQVRGVLTSLDGRTGAARVFGPGKTPRSPVAMIETARRVVFRLAREQGSEVALVQAGRCGVTLDRREAARQLDAVATRLEAVLDAFGEAETDAVRHRLEKEELAAQLHREQGEIDRVLGGLWQLAGLGQVETTVRAAQGRRRTASAKTEEPATATVEQVLGTCHEASEPEHPEPAPVISEPTPAHPAHAEHLRQPWPPHSVHTPGSGGTPLPHRVRTGPWHLAEVADLVR
jgi:hypothetical protein